MRNRTAWIGIGVGFAVIAAVVALSATGKAPFLESPAVRIDRGQGVPNDFVVICDKAIAQKSSSGGLWLGARQNDKPRVMQSGKPQTVMCRAKLADNTEASFEVHVFCDGGQGCFNAL